MDLPFATLTLARWRHFPPHNSVDAGRFWCTYNVSRRMYVYVGSPNLETFDGPSRLAVAIVGAGRAEGSVGACVPRPWPAAQNSSPQE